MCFCCCSGNCIEFTCSFAVFNFLLKCYLMQVLKRDIPWETYMTTKLISATDLQLLRRYDKKTESARAQLLDEVNLLQQLFSLSLSHTHIYRNLCQFLCVRSR